MPKGNHTNHLRKYARDEDLQKLKDCFMRFYEGDWVSAQGNIKTIAKKVEDIERNVAGIGDSITEATKESLLRQYKIDKLSENVARNSGILLLGVTILGVLLAHQLGLIG